MDTKDIPGGILTFVLGLIIMGFMVFLIYTQSSALGQANNLVQQERAALTADQDHLKTLKQLKKDHPNAREELNQVSKRIPTTPSEDDVINTMEKYAAESGLDCTEIVFLPRVANAGYSDMPFKAIFNGSYRGITNLLHRIQYGLRTMRIDDIKISQGDKSGQLKAEIMVSAFTTAGAAPAATTSPPAANP